MLTQARVMMADGGGPAVAAANEHSYDIGFRLTEAAVCTLCIPVQFVHAPGKMSVRGLDPFNTSVMLDAFTTRGQTDTSFGACANCKWNAQGATQ
ncbi:hypothetical protein N7520_008061 [Penicillium odoratum]|uniref:uncharacterized protein n=1 Tax=Penicillium odoratum TaxID=1167516 RepID=UPI002548C111|nr:uncharacterized protein N7520_008061 [Penicillium odoratum]KAJ5760905.1 hypothetical protein N7520_008061 [Penicillium odoratum]